MSTLVHFALAPGESLLPGIAERIATVPPDVAAVILPLAPQGEGRVALAARRYFAAWDARYHHDQTYYAPAARIASRVKLPGWTAADGAPTLARALDAGERVIALREPCVATHVAGSLDTFIAWSREEGAAWGRLARRDARFAPFATRSRAAWWRHNVFEAHRRAGEVAQATRRFDPAVTLLHLARGSAWSGACALAYGL